MNKVQITMEDVRATFIHKNKQEEYRMTEIKVKITSHKSIIYTLQEKAPSWHHEGMEVVIGNKNGDVEFSGIVVQIDSDQDGFGFGSQPIVYKCLND